MSDRKLTTLEYLQIEEDRILEEHQGGNSLVLKCEGKGSRDFGLKIYLGDISRQQQMINRESKAILFLESCSFLNIPRNFNPNFELNVVTFDWFEGEKGHNDDEGLQQLLRMTLDLYALTADHNDFPNAVDAAFNTDEIKIQLRERLERIERINDQKSLSISTAEIESRIEIALAKIPTQLKFNEISLSLSDMGTHNLLRANDKRYQFIDFEFFGRDSLVKLMADFWLHPQNQFSNSSIHSFQESLSEATGWDSTNLMRTLPLFTLKWSLIAYARELRDLKSGNLPSAKTPSSSSKVVNYLNYFDSIIDQENPSELSTFNNFLEKEGD